jgi:hypothetical protein
MARSRKQGEEIEGFLVFTVDARNGAGKKRKNNKEGRKKKKEACRAFPR